MMGLAHTAETRVGRKKLFPEAINLSLPEGTKDRIDSVLDDGEERLAMIREAIDREIVRRERLRRKNLKDA